MKRKRRSINQMKEEDSFRILRQKLPEAWVIHEYGPDYGIDYVVELFDFVDGGREFAETLGELFYVQLKASSCVEYLTQKVYPRGNVEKGDLVTDKSESFDVEVVKFQLEMSELLTVQAMGPAIPVLLLLVDVKSERAFYLCLNDYVDKIVSPEDPGFASKGSKYLHIPTLNEVGLDEQKLVGLRVYGKRAKMYGAFSRFHYQRQEIQRCRGLARVNFHASPADKLNMVKVFVASSLRLSVWENHEFWVPMKWSYKELEDVRLSIEDGIKECELEDFLEYCDEHVWRRLCNLPSMYEELVREWFLPTYLSQLLSYPGKCDAPEE